MSNTNIVADLQRRLREANERLARTTADNLHLCEIVDALTNERPFVDGQCTIEAARRAVGSDTVATYQGQPYRVTYHHERGLLMTRSELLNLIERYQARKDARRSQ